MKRKYNNNLQHESPMVLLLWVGIGALQGVHLSSRFWQFNDNWYPRRMQDDR